MPTRVAARARAARALVAAAALVLATAACGGPGPAAGGSDGSPPTGEGGLTVYSGRSEELVGPLLERFTADTGIQVQARYGTSASMAAQLLEEGERSPADVFFSQDAGALGAVNTDGRFAALPEATLARVAPEHRSDDGRWVGVSARARVMVYDTQQVLAAQLPRSVYDLTSAAWRGRLAVAPTNASFQTFVTAMRVRDGDQRARQFLEGLVADDVQVREGNAQIVEDVERGAVAAGLVNHYYLGELAQERGVAPDALRARLHFFPGGDIGSLVNVAGVGVLQGAAGDPDAQEFVDYLLSPPAQRYFAEETFEYPVVAGVAGPAGVPPLDELPAPDIDLNDLGSLEATIALIRESGLTP